MWGANQIHLNSILKSEICLGGQLAQIKSLNLKKEGLGGP